jgi:hypothetical protein
MCWRGIEGQDRVGLFNPKRASQREARLVWEQYRFSLRRSARLIDATTKCSYNLTVRYEWDETKRRSNRRKHGIDFQEAASVFEGDTVTIEDDRQDYGETRYVTFGIWRGVLIAIAHTETDEAIRIISARKATRHETRHFFSQIGN